MVNRPRGAVSLAVRIDIGSGSIPETSAPAPTNSFASRPFPQHQDAMLMIRGNLACIRSRLSAFAAFWGFTWRPNSNWSQRWTALYSSCRPGVLNELRNIAPQLVSSPGKGIAEEVALPPRRSLAVPSRDCLAERAVRRGCPLQVRFMCSQLSGETCLSRSSGMLRFAAASGLWRD
jgi:hypothetical protein